MRFFSLTLLLVLCLAIVHDAEAGWFGSSSPSDATLQKKLADAEKKASIKTAEAKATAKKYKADLAEKTANAKKQATQKAKAAKAESEGIFAKKKQQLKNFFN